MKLTFRQDMTIICWILFAKYRAQYYDLRILDGMSIVSAYKDAKTTSKADIKERLNSND